MISSRLLRFSSNRRVFFSLSSTKRPTADCTSWPVNLSALLAERSLYPMPISRDKASSGTWSWYMETQNIIDVFSDQRSCTHIGELAVLCLNISVLTSITLNTLNGNWHYDFFLYNSHLIHSFTLLFYFLSLSFVERHGQIPSKIKSWSNSIPIKISNIKLQTEQFISLWQPRYLVKFSLRRTERLLSFFKIAIVISNHTFQKLQPQVSV